MERANPIKVTKKTNRVIYSTTDYDRFILLKENRECDTKRSNKHIEKLKRKITAKDLSVPIIVNENFQILEGQHRYKAYSQLKLPIAYEIREGFTIYDIITINNTNMPWDWYDWLNFHRNMYQNNEYNPKFDLIDLKKHERCFMVYNVFKEYNETYNKEIFRTIATTSGITKGKLSSNQLIPFHFIERLKLCLELGKTYMVQLQNEDLFNGHFIAAFGIFANRHFLVKRKDTHKDSVNNYTINDKMISRFNKAFENHGFGRTYFGTKPTSRDDALQTMYDMFNRGKQKTGANYLKNDF
jgi:hypothetical protein